MSEEQNTEKSNLVIRFQSKSGEVLPIHYPKDWQKHPEATELYMTSLAKQLRNQGWRLIQ